MQIKQIIQQADINKTDVELIIAHVLKKTCEFVLAHPETKIRRSKDQKIRQLIKQRVRDVSLAYLTGHKEFYGLDFVVNKHTLIPRPETELIVSLALDKIRTIDHRLLTIVDVGTGSGCIPISIAKTMVQWHDGSMIYYATDISKPALKIAKQNAKKHKIKIKFLRGNLLTPLFDNGSMAQWNNETVIITANLPYLTPQQFKREPSIQHEPKLALVAGQDGLKYYKQLFKQIQKLITYNLRLITFLEIDPSQIPAIKKLIKQHLPKSKITIHKDLARKNRVVEIEILYYNL